jgi:hypothetical protein
LSGNRTEASNAPPPPGEPELRAERAADGRSRAAAVFGIVMLLIAGALLGLASLPLSAAFDRGSDSPASTSILEGLGLIAMGGLALVAGIWLLRRWRELRASKRRPLPRRSEPREDGAPKARSSRPAVVAGVVMLLIAGALLAFAAGVFAIAINPTVIEGNPPLDERIRAVAVVAVITAVPLVAGIWFLRRR